MVRSIRPPLSWTFTRRLGVSLGRIHRSEVHTHCLEAKGVGFQPSQEVRVAFGAGLGPCHLRKGGRTGKRHVFHVGRGWNELAPQLPLYPQDVMRLIGGQLFGDRIETINACQRQVSANRFRLLLGVFALVVVKVKVTCERHHDVVSRFCCGDAAF